MPAAASDMFGGRAGSRKRQSWAEGARLKQESRQSPLDSPRVNGHLVLVQAWRCAHSGTAVPAAPLRSSSLLSSQRHSAGRAPSSRGRWSRAQGLLRPGLLDSTGHVPACPSAAGSQGRRCEPRDANTREERSPLFCLLCSGSRLKLVCCVRQSPELLA